VQRRYHAASDDTGAESPRRAAAHLAVEHQAHLAGAADIKVLADHLLEEDAPGHRLVEYLGERGRRDRGPETDAAGVAAIFGTRLDAVVQRLERYPTLGTKAGGDLADRDQFGGGTLQLTISA
jgi:hypothetical protein